jgi:DNA polymerase-3 subunit epsilon
MNFVALDFETANADLISICQVGLVTFSEGAPVATYSVLVDPDDYFDGINVSIHGIDETRVRGAPRDI